MDGWMDGKNDGLLDVIIEDRWRKGGKSVDHA